MFFLCVIYVLLCLINWIDQDILSWAWEGLKGDNILLKTLFLILPLTLAQIWLRAAQISSENLWRDLRCPSASLKVFVLQIQYKGACRHLDPCCAADAAQGHTNPPCDILQQQGGKGCSKTASAFSQTLTSLILLFLKNAGCDSLFFLFLALLFTPFVNFCCKK